MRSFRLPGRASHILAWIVTLLLTLSLTVAFLSLPLRQVLTDRSLHESVALDQQVVQLQYARIEAKVQELAAEYAFQPETVMALIQEDSLTQYTHQVIDWWMGLLAENPTTEVPSWDTGAIEAAVREDEVFKENTPANLRRSTARDKIAYPIGMAIKRAVLPLRADIFSALLPSLMNRFDLPLLTHAISLIPAVSVIISLLLALLLLALMFRRISKAALYIGAGLTASGLCSLGLCLLLGCLHLGESIAELSSLLALQYSLLLTRLSLPFLLGTVIAMLAGFGLIGLHQADMRRLCRRRHRSL